MTPQLDLIPFCTYRFSREACNLCVQEGLAIAPYLGSRTSLCPQPVVKCAIHICEIILLILITCVYRALIKLLC